MSRRRGCDLRGTGCCLMCRCAVEGSWPTVPHEVMAGVTLYKSGMCTSVAIYIYCGWEEAGMAD